MFTCQVKMECKLVIPGTERSAAQWPTHQKRITGRLEIVTEIR
jgi:hypothetical protein